MLCLGMSLHILNNLNFPIHRMQLIHFNIILLIAIKQIKFSIK